MKRIGFIGLGAVVSKYHIPALQRSHFFDIVAGFDVDPAKAAIINAIGANCAHSLDEMIERDDIDIYVVATPPKDHYKTAKRLLEAGKVVLLEKPATETRDQFDELLAIAGKIQLHFAFHFAGSADTRGFREWMGERNLHIEEFRVHLNDPHLLPNAFDIDSAGRQLGGAYLDLAANALSVLHALGVEGLDMVDRYQIFSPTSPGIDFHAHCELVGRGVSGTMTLDWSAGINCKGLRVRCSDGQWYTLNNSAQSVVNALGEEICPPVEGNRLINHYIGVYQDFELDLRSNTCNRRMAEEINRVFFQFYDLPNGPGYCQR